MPPAWCGTEENRSLLVINLFRLLDLDYVAQRKTFGSNKAKVSAHRPALTFDLQEHELLVRHGAVVGHLLRLAGAAQVHAAEVLLAGQTGQRRFRVTGGLRHYRKD